MLVLEVKMTLISLGTLDSKDYKCIVAGGVMKVVRGAMVIMNDELIKSLYKLAGSTVTNGGGAYSWKKNESVEVELDWRKTKDCETNISVEASSSGPKLQER